MKHLFFFICILLSVALGSFILILVPHKKQVGGGGRLRIVCTTGIIADAVRVVGGDRVNVVALMGPGVDPHLYRARESDVHTLSDADIIFYNGLHLEGRMASVLEAMGSIATVAVADALEQSDIIQSDFEQVFDPHIWHSVLLWKKVVHLIESALALHDPSYKKMYKQNARSYLNSLNELDMYVRDQTARIRPKQRALVTAHDAFGYFGATYGFTVIGLQGMSTDAEVGVQDIHHLVDFIVQNKIRAFFIESSIPERNVQAVQQAVSARGWEVAIGPELFSDALGDADSDADTYIGMITHNIDALVKALG